jgi:hypothetical protein
VYRILRTILVVKVLPFSIFHLPFVIGFSAGLIGNDNCEMENDNWKPCFSSAKVATNHKSCRSVPMPPCPTGHSGDYGFNRPGINRFRKGERRYE